MSGARPVRDGDPLHVVDDRPFPPPAPPAVASDTASPYRLFWRRFRRRRMAYLAFWLLAMMYLVVVPFAETIAPYGRDQRFPDAISHPPQLVRLWGESGLAAPFIYATSMDVDLEAFKRNYTEDRSKPQTLRWLCDGEPYHLLGLVEIRTRLFCAADGGTLFLFGTDTVGRDVFSRVISGARVSLLLGFISVGLGAIPGVALGLIAAVVALALAFS